jgi:pimeloyl-ACP methyl ester carboxylesterase
MKVPALILFLTFHFFSFSQDTNPLETNVIINEHIEGSLLLPASGISDKLVIIIAGSGPTDRNGNQNFLKSNNLKKLAQGLSKENIASFRYDKRIVKQIRKGKVDNNIMFDDFVIDANSVIDYFSTQDTYKSIYIIGHSQGSLVGLLALSDKITGFISLAGAGNSIDLVIMDQIEKMAPGLVADSQKVFDILKEGKTTTDYPPALASVFNIETQPFIANWMQYDPKEIISKTEIPILIINGTKDLQVSVDEAKSLQEANENAKLEIIENMNHVLFFIEGDDLENSKSYNESFRTLSPGLIEAITSFIK